MASNNRDKWIEAYIKARKDAADAHAKWNQLKKVRMALKIYVFRVVFLVLIAITLLAVFLVTALIFYGVTDIGSLSAAGIIAIGSTISTAIGSIKCGIPHIRKIASRVSTIVKGENEMDVLEMDEQNNQQH